MDANEGAPVVGANDEVVEEEIIEETLISVTATGSSDNDGEEKSDTKGGNENNDDRQSDNDEGQSGKEDVSEGEADSKGDGEPEGEGGSSSAEESDAEESDAEEGEGGECEVKKGDGKDVDVEEGEGDEGDGATVQEEDNDEGSDGKVNIVVAKQQKVEGKKATATSSGVEAVDADEDSPSNEADDTEEYSPSNEADNTDSSTDSSAESDDTSTTSTTDSSSKRRKRKRRKRAQLKKEEVAAPACAYELEKLKNVERNQAYLKELGIPGLAAGLSGVQIQSPPKSSPTSKKRLENESNSLTQNADQSMANPLLPCKEVQALLRTIANLSDLEVQHIFKTLALFPQISAGVLETTAFLLTDVFEDSRNVSDEDFIRPPRRSTRLKPAGELSPPVRRSGRKNRKEESQILTPSKKQPPRAVKKGKKVASESESTADSKSSAEEEDEEENDSIEEVQPLEPPVKRARPSSPPANPTPKFAEKSPTPAIKGDTLATNPQEWSVKKRNNLPSSRGTTIPPRPPRPALFPSSSDIITASKPTKMSEDTWSGEGYHLDFTTPDEPFVESQVRKQPSPTQNMDVRDHEIEDLDLAIEEQQLQLLRKKKAAMQARQGELQRASGEGPSNPAANRSYDAHQKAKRRQILKHQVEVLPIRETEGQKRFVVEVDNAGLSVGDYRGTWLTCLRGQTGDIDFSVDNYSQHDMAMLLKVKENVDSVFEYRGGLQRVTDKAFHTMLKGQLKSARYQLKKLMLEGHPKPPHIRQDHWINLSKLIVDERKVIEAERMRANRAHVKRLSSAGRSEGAVKANLVMAILGWFYCSQLSHMTK